MKPKSSHGRLNNLLYVPVVDVLPPYDMFQESARHKQFQLDEPDKFFLHYL